MNKMIPYNQTEAIALEDAFPDFLNGGGIFDSLDDFDFVPNSVVALALNQEYFLNRSGRKLASPLVSRLVDTTTGALTQTAIAQLASIIRMRYRYKWGKIWEDLVSTLSPFANIDYSETVEHGHAINKSGDNVLIKTGSETHSLSSNNTQEESFPDANGRMTTRQISGGWKDTDNTSRTRTGTETSLESFPDAQGRITQKVTTGGWSDTDGTSTTRTGIQTITDKGETQDSVFGFNSSNPVPTSRSGPLDSITQETFYGENGIKDQKSGSITRAYGDTGLNEKTVESGSKKLETSYGESGLKDVNSGDTTRLYQGYNDVIMQTGRKRTTDDNTKSDTLSYDERTDTASHSNSEVHSGTDVKTVQGYNIRRLSDKLDILKEMYENPVLYDFFEIVYSDIDAILTCPIFI